MSTAPESAGLPGRGAPAENADEFMARVLDEGASNEAAKQATAARVALSTTRMPPGRLLPGPTARWWQHAVFVMLGGDPRLAGSAKFMHAFSIIAGACALASPLIWTLRLVIQ
jgi:hypothetical protein